MYSIKDSYKILKSSAIGGAVSAIGIAVVIPALGLLAHFSKYASDSDVRQYSLKNRSEVAYSFNTPDEHKYYYETPYYNGYAGDSQKEYYLASPYATYGTIAAFGLAGALFGGMSTAEYIKKKKSHSR